MESIVNAVNDLVWSPALVFLCLATGLYFSVRSGFLQLRLIREMWRLLFQSREDDHGVSSFQALSMTLAGRVGTGNIAGVATAICFGGPGALFWMWMVAFLGSASAFIESTLGQIYKEKIRGEYTGGPAFYLEKGAGSRLLGWIFAIITIIACGLLLPSVQSNSIAAAVNNAFGIPNTITAACLTTLLCFILFGGLHRIANFTTIVVPFMAQAYVIVSLIIVFYNYEQIPHVVSMIFSSAFGMDSAFGAIIGMAVSWGVKRGIYSNEAGQGTGPHASSAASVSHPAKQGLVQAFSVYIDTWFVCSATGFMILTTGCYNVINPEGMSLFQGLQNIEAGPVYTQMAVESVMPGFGSPFVAVALFFFAFTTILAYGYISETNVRYINRTLKWPVLIALVRIAVMFSCAFGAIKSASLAWTLGDIGVGLMAWVNIFAILWLQKPALKCLRDYEEQMKAGVDPVFHPEKLGIENASYWTMDRAERNLEIEREEGVENAPMARGLRRLIQKLFNNH